MIHIIKEEWVNLDLPFDLFKNPSSSERRELRSGSRGVVTMLGDFYITPEETYHHVLIPILGDYNLIPKKYADGKKKSYTNNLFFPVQYFNSQVWLSDTYQGYNKGIVDNVILDKVLANFRKKNPSTPFNKRDFSGFLLFK